MRDYPIKPKRAYVPGLSARGAAAMAAMHADLYAAHGIHSGLACACARPTSAFEPCAGWWRNRGRSPSVATIIFHGHRESKARRSISAEEQLLGSDLFQLDLQRARNPIEGLIKRIKQYRRVAKRCERLAASYGCFVQLF